MYFWGTWQKHKWKIHQLDVKFSFLNAELKEEVYLVEPEGLIHKGHDHLVCKLNKAIYGLKHAHISWYTNIDYFFNEKGFVKRKSDPNLYVKKDKKWNVCLIYLYVDGLIITRIACKLKDLGQLNYCLGL